MFDHNWGGGGGRPLSGGHHPKLQFFTPPLSYALVRLPNHNLDLRRLKTILVTLLSLIANCTWSWKEDPMRAFMRYNKSLRTINAFIMPGFA